MSLQVATAATNVVRDGHFETISGVDTRALLLELARTNNLSFSQDLSNAAWTKVNSTATANQAVAPDGTITASVLTEDGSTGGHTVTRGTTTTVSTKQAYSFFAKAGARSWCYIRTDDRDGGTRLSWVNLATGVVGTRDASHTIQILAFANGWYRVICLASSQAGAGATSVTIGMATADFTANYTGDGTSTLYFWGMQHEQDAACASSYIATAGGTATRSADILYFPFPYTPQAMTVYVKFVERGSILSAGPTPGLFSISDAAANAPEFLVDNPGAFYTAFHHNGSSSVTSAVAAAPSIGDTVEVRAVLAATGAVAIGQSINGAAETLGTTSAALALPTAWSAQRMYVGGQGSANPGANAFLAVKVMRGVQTLSTMRAI